MLIRNLATWLLVTVSLLTHANTSERTDPVTDPETTNHEESPTDDPSEPPPTETDDGNDAFPSPAHLALLTSQLVRLGKVLNKYLTPVIVALGFFGNTCTLILMRRPSMKKSSSSTYFITLAMADLLTVTNHIMFLWPEDNFPVSSHYWMKNDLLCKARDSTFGFSLTWSGLILVALTVERFVVTTFPLKSKVWCTRRNAKITVTTISVALAVIYFPLVWRFNPRWGKCNRVPYLIFMFDQGVWFITALYTYIPTPILLILNASLATQLFKAKSRRARMTNSIRNLTQRERMAALKSEAQFTRLTVTVMGVSITYLVLTVPTTTVNIYAKMWLMNQGGVFSPELMFAHSTCIMLRVLNHSINFILYLLTSPKLRTEFREMLTCKNRGKDHIFSSEMVGTSATTISNISVALAMAKN